MPKTSIHGVVVTTPHYKSAGLGSNPSPGSKYAAQPNIYLFRNQGKGNCGNLDLAPWVG